MQKILQITLLIPFLYGCDESKSVETKPPQVLTVEEELPYNQEIGIGGFTSYEVDDMLDTALVSKGSRLYTEKCAVCHLLNDQVLTGPGWKAVTERRKPVWIMNYLTNTDEMLDTDPSLKEMIVTFKTRMTNLHLTGEEARALLEFMRENDSKSKPKTPHKK